MIYTLTFFSFLIYIFFKSGVVSISNELDTLFTFMELSLKTERHFMEPTNIVVIKKNLMPKATWRTLFTRVQQG